MDTGLRHGLGAASFVEVKGAKSPKNPKFYALLDTQNALKWVILVEIPIVKIKMISEKITKFSSYEKDLYRILKLFMQLLIISKHNRRSIK